LLASCNGDNNSNSSDNSGSSNNTSNYKQPDSHPRSLPPKSYPSVSVVIATYGERHAYHELIYKAYKAQDYNGKLNLIIYDNASTPSPFFTADNAAKYDHSVIYKHTTKTPNELSLGAKRNKLVEMSASDILVVWDDDDFYGKNYVSFMVEKLGKLDADFLKSTKWLMAHFNKKGDGLEYHTVSPNVGKTHGWGFSYIFNRKVYTETKCRYADQNRGEEDPFAECVDQHKKYSFKRFEFDALSAKPYMVKFESYTPKKIVSMNKNWQKTYDIRYGKNDKFQSRNPEGPPLSIDQVANIKPEQSQLLREYSKLYQKLGQ
jgi:glycosyltransferase involved in cell wall biosynthesis